VNSPAAEDASPIVEHVSPNSAKPPRGRRDVEEWVASINPLAAISLASLRETVERPLFNQSRAPKPKPESVQQVEAKEEEPQASPADFTLLGVVIANNDKTVLLRLNKTDEVLRLTAGQSFSEWRLTGVQPRSVVIENGELSFPLKLFEQPSEPSAFRDNPPANPEEDESDQSEAISELNNG